MWNRLRCTESPATTIAAMENANSLQHIMGLLGSHIFPFLGASPWEVCNGWEMQPHSTCCGELQGRPSQEDALCAVKDTLSSHTTLLYMY